MLNRKLVHDATHYASARARQAGVTISFAVTTNGTLLEQEDIDLFRSYGFAVTISLDGSREVNDKSRQARRGSAYDAVVHRVKPLVAAPGRARVAARCTLTALDLDVHRHVEHLLSVGFDEVGVSPVRTSPDRALALTGSDWTTWLAGMIETANADWSRVQNGAAFRFSNFALALKQLEAGDYRSLPCGAAANYVSVGAGGDYFTCHRTVDQEQFRVGQADSGPDLSKRVAFVTTRRVDNQEPCRSCWARYLCGGGCHAEVVGAGRSGCDAIRSWLEFCIRLYPHVLRKRPDLLVRCATYGKAKRRGNTVFGQAGAEE